MVINVSREMNFDDIKDMVWSGATYTINRVEEEQKQDELMELINEVFYGETIDETRLNDFLWFDTDYIYENLDITDED